MYKNIAVFCIISLFSCQRNKIIEKIESNDNLEYRFSKNFNSNGEPNSIQCDKSFKSIKLTTNSEKTRFYLDSIVNIYFNLDLEKYNEASKFYLQKSVEANDTISEAKALRHRGNYYYKTQVLDSAFYYFVKSEKKYLTIFDEKNLGNVLLKKGIVQYEVNDFLGASISLNKSYSLINKSKDKQKIFACLISLGNVFTELKDYTKAIYYHNEALKIVKKYSLNTSENQESITLNNLGYIYQKDNKDKTAIKFFISALNNKNLRNENPYLFSKINDNLAYSKLLSNNLNNLPNLFFESLKIRDSLGNNSLITGSNIHLSEYYDKTKDYNTSISFANKALKTAKKSKIPVDIVAALKQAAAVDKINASEYTNQYIKINDSLLTAERRNLDRFARIQLETDEVIKENKVLDNKNQNLIYYFLGIISIISLLFFANSQKQKQKIILLKQEQQATNQQIFDLMINQQDAIAQTRIVEKKRIAKELHDGVLSRMFGTRLFLDTQNVLTTEEAINNRFSALEDLKNIEQQIREISHDMNSEKGKIINNFVGIVLNLLEDQRKKYATVLEYEISEDIRWEKLDNFAKINLYRILQESLQNTNKYANASWIKVDFYELKNTISLSIADNGIGFDVKKAKKGIGIANMIERAEESGGNYIIESTKNVGTTTTVQLPTNKKTKNQLTPST